MQKITAVILTLKEDVNVEEIPEVLQHEREVVEEWKQAGYIHDMYLRQAKNGAVIMFNEMNEDKVKELISTLPLFPYFKPAEYLGLLK